MKKTLLCIAALATFASTSALASEASSQKAADTAVKFRQALFQLVRSNMGPLGAMAKGNIEYDASVMQTNAKRIKQLAEMAPDYWRTDTRKFEVDTGAKDSIWENTSDFAQKAEDMRVAAEALEKVAMAKDSDNYRSAIGTLGATCKACHDDYKKD